jgi:hypothetical protein
MDRVYEAEAQCQQTAGEFARTGREAVNEAVEKAYSRYSRLPRWMLEATPDARALAEGDDEARTYYDYGRAATAAGRTIRNGLQSPAPMARDSAGSPSRNS